MNILKDYENICVLITASGSIKSACNYPLAFKDPGFLNLGSKLAIEEIKNKINCQIFLAIENLDKKFFNFYPYNKIKIIETGKTKSVTQTIEKSLNKISSEFILINPITSIPSNSNFENPFIEFGSSLLIKENWSSIKVDKFNKPIFYKKSDKNIKGDYSFPFTGRIFAKRIDILKAIKEIKDDKKNDLINLAEKLFLKKKVKISYSNWLDIGHKATYPITKTFNIGSRYFNNISYDKIRNVIKKKSKQKSKIVNEIEYYKSLPTEIKRYYPAILEIEISKDYASYEMEYIAKPNLAEIFLYSKIGPNSIKRIFESIERIYKTFYFSKPIIIENAKWLYSQKTKFREQELKKLFVSKKYKVLEKLYFNDFCVNDIRLPSLRKSFKLLDKKLKNFEKKRKLYLGHGDLCFNNILIDPVFAQIKIIDPKAEKHNDLNMIGLMDNFYDLAKLNHSVDGLYDSIVNNLFNLKVIDLSNLMLETYKPDEYDLFNKFFNELIIRERIQKEDLNLLTANLFLTMLPLHIDNIHRMVCFSLIGSMYLDKLN